jgi:hypothetical protein
MTPEERAPLEQEQRMQIAARNARTISAAKKGRLERKLASQVKAQDFKAFDTLTAINKLKPRGSEP